MEEIKLEGLDLSCFYEKLKNDLEVVLLPYSNKKNYFMSYATRYGSETTSFTPIGKDEEIKVPDGIAHFLEHKMFEQEDGVDPFTYFSESGTGSNASTSFDSTQYICYGTKKFDDNLRFLLNFVNSPYYTDENVEKEKGIIAEELKMYADIPEFNLEMKIRENVYHNHPRRVDIGGTVEEVYKITKEDLYTCYKNFYSPNNMFLLIAGNFDKDSAINIIHDVMDNIENRGKPKIKKIKEPKSVLKKEDVMYSDIKVPKVAIGIKIPNNLFDNIDDLNLDLYLNMFTTMCFGSSSLFREKIRNRKLVSGFYKEWESIEDYHTFYIMVSTEKPDDFIVELKNELLNLKLNEEDFTRLKKVWIANEVKMIDDIDTTIQNIYDDLLKYRKIVNDKVNIIRNMDIKILKDIVSKIDFDNISIVKMLGKEKNTEN